MDYLLKFSLSYSNIVRVYRYYAVATPGATQRLLFGLLEAPPTWAPDALVVAVALVELLRAADNYTSSVQVCLYSESKRILFLRIVLYCVIGNSLYAELVGTQGCFK